MTDLDGRDDVDRFRDDQMRNPAFAAAYQDASNRSRLYVQLIGLRKQSGLTPEEVAARMDLPLKRIVQFEDGAVDPPWLFLQRYARAVGVRLTVTVEAGDG